MLLKMKKNPVLGLFTSKKVAVGMIMVTILIIMAIFAPFIAQHDPLATNPAEKLHSPSFEYPLGTDQLGRCIFSRIVWGARASLGYSFCVLIITVILGTVIGLIPGYVGGKLDHIIMAVTNVFMSFPSTVLALAIAGILGPSIRNLILAMSCI